ncbi:MAG: hypothetical protein BGO01_09415 [Armatimonadetes bacterium 55-13]|nr:MinD/ParA family protein [Armatimonadota bacterium]ODU51536.1 MAG: hypothetical protein ABT09_03700 [bacterium SCN 57-13]OJU62627.1 MAG: hypothetical protein BGO01_09415 [Armatimonadetes bacterium 55-13]
MRILSITSGKGGVGKTNLAANLGIALSQQGSRVVMFDADLGLANLDVVLGTGADFSLHHAIDGNLSLADVIAAGPAGTRFLSGGAGLSKLINISRKRLQNFLLELAQLDKSTDYLIFDTGAGVDAKVMTFLKAADDVILVVTPEPASVADAYATIKVLLRSKKNAHIQILMNQVEHERQAEAVYRKLNDIAGHFLNADLSYIGSVRCDSEILPWIRARQPFLLADPRLKASKDVIGVAQRIQVNRNVYDVSETIVHRLEFAFGITSPTEDLATEAKAA